MTTTVAIIGAGRVGGACGRLLRQAGYTVTAVTAREQRNADAAREFIGAGRALTDVVAASTGADIVLITTPDGAIGPVCKAISDGGGFRPGAIVVHTSGAQGRDLLDPSRRAGALRAVIHPIQSVPSRDLGVRNIPGSYCRMEADPGAEEAVHRLIAALGCRELVLPGWRSDADSAALYHAGAVVVSNHFVSLVDHGLRCFEALGADRRDALRAVLPLIRGTLANIEAVGVPEALTGPVSRGDVRTVQGHLEALAHRAPELDGLYRALARHTVAVARAKGTIDDAAADALLDLLG